MLQMQAEIRRLKEQLALKIMAGPSIPPAECRCSSISLENDDQDYKAKFIKAMLFREQAIQEKKVSMSYTSTCFIQAF